MYISNSVCLAIPTYPPSFFNSLKVVVLHVVRLQVQALLLFLNALKCKRGKSRLHPALDSTGNAFQNLASKTERYDANDFGKPLILIPSFI